MLHPVISFPPYGKTEVDTPLNSGAPQSEPPTPPTHDDLEALLSRVDAEIGAAEAHGLATGLQLLSDSDASLLIRETLAEAPEADVLARECHGALQRLHGAIAGQLRDPSLTFEPLLPGDGQSLRVRAGALRDWCSGLLYGLGLNVGSARTFSPETSEALEDLSEMTRLETATIGDSEEEERAYAELLEFVRMAVMLIRADAGMDGPQ